MIDERDPLSLGHARSARAKAALPHADAMLAVGCRFTEVMTDWRRMRVPPSLVQIDLDPDQIGMNYPVAVGIVADARRALAMLCCELCRQSRPSGWGRSWEQARGARPAQARVADRDAPRGAARRDARLHRRLRDGLSHAGRLAVATALAGSFIRRITSPWAGPSPRPSARRSPCRDRPVVSVSGDGGFVMTAQELATAARYRLRVIALVHNDSTYGAIKNIQDRAHDGRYLDIDLNNPDFSSWPPPTASPPARAHRRRAAPAVRQALAHAGPSLIEVPDPGGSCAT